MAKDCFSEEKNNSIRLWETEKLEFASLLLLSFTWVCFVWILLPDNNNYYWSQLKGLNFRKKAQQHWTLKLEKLELASILSVPFQLYFNLFCLNYFSWQLLTELRKRLESMVHMYTSLCPFHLCWKKHTRIFFIASWFCREKNYGPK